MKRESFVYFALVLILAVFLVELGLYSFGASGNTLFGFYPFFNVGRIDHYIDLQVVTLNGYGCNFPVESIYQKSCYFNPTNIPRLFIQIARILHIGGHNTKVVGFAMGSISIALLFLAYTYCLKRVQAIFAAVLVVSGFPFRLALERGNIDLVVLSLLLVSSFFLSLSNSSKTIKSILCVAISSLCVLTAVFGKVYPVLVLPAIALVIAAAQHFSRREKVLLTSLVSGLLIGSVLSLLPDLSHMTGSSYRELAGGLGYGLMTSPDKNLGEFFTFLIKFVIGGFVVIFSVLDKDDFFSVRDSAKELTILLQSSHRDRLIAIAFLFGASLFLGTYFVFVNGIYRLSVSISLLVPWFVYFLSAKYKNLINCSQGGLCLILTFWATTIVGYRPYLDGVNVQHLTQLFVEFCLYPLASGYLISVLTVFVVSLKREGYLWSSLR